MVAYLQLSRTMKTLVALCVGHSRKINGRIEGGAVSVGNVNEHTYNVELANMISALLSENRIDCHIIAEYEGVGYGNAQRWLADEIKCLGADLAIELHFNSASPEANGHEWLYYHSSTNGQRLARRLNEEMCYGLPAIKSRGAKPRFAGDRGTEFLRGTHCPAVIAEPFFGSNASDWKLAVEFKAKIARAIVSGILEYLD